MASDVAVAAVPKRSRFRKILWGLLALVALVGGAYAGGRLQMQARLAQTDESLRGAQSDLAASKQQQAELQRGLLELEARRRIHLASMAFDQNNFGVAQAHLQAAASLLMDAAPPKQDAAMSALAVAMRKLQLSPSLDLEAQRKVLLDMAAKFDDLRPPRAPAP